VTAGGTEEEIDTVRVITNRSTGKMGVAIAEQAYKRGAEVLLLKSRNSKDSDYPIKIIEFSNVEDLYSKIKREINKYDTIIHAAAVSDFSVDKINTKISSEGEMILKLKPTRKIIDEIKKMNPKIKLIGFKLEDTDLLKKANKKLVKCKAEFIVANNSESIGSERSTVYIVKKNNVIKIKDLDKEKIAIRILENI